MTNSKDRHPLPILRKFLADENIPSESILSLRNQGIDVVSVAERNSGMADEAVLNLAESQDRILLTFDQDFGELAFRRKLKSKGIVLLRFEPKSSEEVTKSLFDLLSRRIELRNSFTVIDTERIRTFPYPKK